MMKTKVIIAVSAVLGICFIVAMALVTRIFSPKPAKHASTEDMYTTETSTERGRQLAQISSSWKRLFMSNQDQKKGRWVPTLAGIIKAGDEGLISSALFTTIHGHPGHLSLDALHESFAHELRTRPMTERSSYSGDVTKFLARAKGGAGSLGRSKSMSHKPTAGRRADAHPKAQRKSLDISVVEMGLTRGMSMKKSPPSLVTMRNGLEIGLGQKASLGSWMRDGQNSKSQGGRTSVKTTAAELAALSIILGSQLHSDTRESTTPNSNCAYGISLVLEPTEDGKTCATLRRDRLGRSQRHAKGSGISPLFAKHLATGSLPYSQDRNVINSILLTEDTLEAIQAGASLYTHPSNVRTPQSRYLTSLPSSQDVKFHVLVASTEVHSSTTLINAVASLPIRGGLTPLASAPLIKTFQFMASGGLAPARLLQRLEGLIDKVHRHAPHLDIFGPLYEPHNAGLLYRERERLGRLATDSGIADTLADRTARMSRYITLLERLMALVPDMKPQDVLDAVQEATKLELQRSYEQAVIAYAGTASPRKSPSIDITAEAGSKPHSRTPRNSPRRSNRSSSISAQTILSSASPTSSEDYTQQNLGKQMEHVLKSDLPLNIDMIAFVARMVIVAWTLSVENVAWEDGEKGFRVPDFESLGGKIVFC